MASTLHKLVITIFGYCSLSIHCLSALLKIHHTSSYKHLVGLINNCSLLDYIEVKFYFYNLSSNFNFYLWNGVLLFQLPLHNHHARLLQLCKVVNTLHKLPQPCDNLTKLQQGCSYFRMGILYTGNHVFLWYTDHSSCNLNQYLCTRKQTCVHI